MKPKAAAPAAATEALVLSEKSVFPAKTGSTWTYGYESAAQPTRLSPGGSGELTFKVTKVSDNANGKQIDLEIRRRGELTDRQRWLVNSKGLYQISAGVKEMIPFSPPQPLVLFDAKTNEPFNWKGTGLCPDGRAGKMQSRSTVLGTQEVDTETGRQAGVAVQTITTFENPKNRGGLQVITWFKPDTGIVRMKQTMLLPQGKVEMTLKLKETNS